MSKQNWLACNDMGTTSGMYCLSACADTVASSWITTVPGTMSPGSRLLLLLVTCSSRHSGRLCNSCRWCCGSGGCMVLLHAQSLAISALYTVWQSLSHMVAAKTHRELYSEFYQDLLQEPLEDALRQLPQPPASVTLFQQMMRDVTTAGGVGVDPVQQVGTGFDQTAAASCCISCLLQMYIVVLFNIQFQT